MAAEPNVAGMARLHYLFGGAAAVSWGLWSADQGRTHWAWLPLSGMPLIFVPIGYSPLHALLELKHQKAS